jgi:hypothetical protein
MRPPAGFHILVTIKSSSKKLNVDAARVDLLGSPDIPFRQDSANSVYDTHLQRLMHYRAAECNDPVVGTFEKSN